MLEATLPGPVHRLHTNRGDIEWSDGRHLHRTDAPAVERADGTLEWWHHGRLHRADGPAMVTPAGDRLYFWQGRAHRDDGPARVMANGDREWFRHGYRHRLDGPAVEHASGRRELWVDGRRAHTRAALERLRTEFTAAALEHHACTPDHPCKGVPRPQPRTTRTVQPWYAEDARAA